MDDTMLVLLERMHTEMREGQKIMSDRFEAIENCIANISAQISENSENMSKEIASIQDMLTEIRYNT